MSVTARRKGSRDRRIDTGNAGRVRPAARTRVPARIDRAVAKADELIEVLRLDGLRQAQQGGRGKIGSLPAHERHHPLTLSWTKFPEYPPRHEPSSEADSGL